jgi:hypothetical protein
MPSLEKSPAIDHAVVRRGEEVKEREPGAQPLVVPHGREKRKRRMKWLD